MIPTKSEPKEYIITEQLLNDIELRIGCFYGSQLIRSRPYNTSKTMLTDQLFHDLDEAYMAGVYDGELRSKTHDATIEKIREWELTAHNDAAFYDEPDNIDRRLHIAVAKAREQAYKRVGDLIETGVNK